MNLSASSESSTKLNESNASNTTSTTKLQSSKQLLWVFLFVLIDVLGISLVLPLLPFYREQFGASPSLIGLLLTVNAFTQMLSAPILGWLSDCYGRKPILLLCISGTIAGFVIMAEAQSLSMLLLSRIVDGLLGGNIALAQAYISDVTNQKERSKGFGYIGAAFGLGFIVGPAIGGMLCVYGFRIPAYVAVVISVLNLVNIQKDVKN